jgi:hypothetical protein
VSVLRSSDAHAAKHERQARPRSDPGWQAGTKLDGRCVAALTEIVTEEAEPALEALAV